MTSKPDRPGRPGRSNRLFLSGACPFRKTGVHFSGTCAKRPRRRLLHDLPAQLAALVSVGVDVDVPLAGQEVGGLRVGEVGRAFERALLRHDRYDDAGILARVGRTMEVAGGGSASKPGEGALPGELLGGGV